MGMTTTKGKTSPKLPNEKVPKASVWRVETQGHVPRGICSESFKEKEFMVSGTYWFFEDTPIPGVSNGPICEKMT